MITKAEKDNAIYLNNWSTVNQRVNLHASHLTPYRLPHIISPCLKGIAHDHPKRPKKPRWDCVTSYIIEIDGRYIRTKSGTIYLLGNIDKKYRRYLRREQPNWDWRKPITIKGE